MFCIKIWSAVQTNFYYLFFRAGAGRSRDFFVWRRSRIKNLEPEREKKWLGSTTRAKIFILSTTNQKFLKRFLSSLFKIKLGASSAPQLLMNIYPVLCRVRARDARLVWREESFLFPPVERRGEASTKHRSQKESMAETLRNIRLSWGIFIPCIFINNHLMAIFRILESGSGKLFRIRLNLELGFNRISFVENTANLYIF